MILERYLQFAIASSREIDAPPSKVWSIICDVDSFPSVFTGVTDVEKLDDGSTRHLDVEEALFDRDARTALGAGGDDNKAIGLGGEGLRVGMRHRIYRATAEKERFSADWVVTAVDVGDAEDGTRSVIFYSTNLAGGITASTTWSVGPLPIEDGGDGQTKFDNTRSVASISLSIVPRTICVIAGRVMCCCVFKRRALANTEKDLEDIAAAACSNV